MYVEEHHVIDELRNHFRKVVSHASHTPNWRARLATALVERWGLLTGAPDGEDSAGRMKVRLESPSEIAVRACDIADATIREFENRNWLDKMPSFAELSGKTEEEK